MKIAIISDTHDNLINIKKCLAFCNKKKVKYLLHCGDWCGLPTMRFIRKNFSGRIIGVLGNAELNSDKMKSFGAKNDLLLKDDWTEIEIDIIKIALSHSPVKAVKLARTKKYDFVFHGHDHKPWLAKAVKTFIANPGNLAGIYYKPTFAVLDTKTKKLELKLIELL